MTAEIENCKVWTRFERTKKDGSVVKLRIQDLPKNRMDDLMNFLSTYFVHDESMHKAAGVGKSKEAIEEYKRFMTKIFELNRPNVAVCCLDTDSKDFDEILAVSTVQLTSNKTSLKDILGELGLEIQCKETESMLNIVSTLFSKCPESVKSKYEWFYEGRGIIVHPEYRGLGIATQIVKQRRMLCKETNIPMTCAWMTSLGSQKAGEKDGWETMCEVSLDELEMQTGLVFEKSVSSYKLMVATETN